MSLHMIEKNNKFEYLEAVLENEFNKDIQSLFQELDLEWLTIISEFKMAVNDLFKECYEKQLLGKKGKIEIFHICYLLSSCLTRKYDIELALYDSNFYFDLNGISKMWNPNFVFKYYEREMSLFEKQAYKNIRKFNYSDIQEIRLEYYDMYFGVLWTVLNYLVPYIRETDYFNKVEKTDSFCITFSKYMVPGWKIEFEI